VFTQPPLTRRNPRQPQKGDDPRSHLLEDPGGLTTGKPSRTSNPFSALTAPSAVNKVR
jgi:hypothetical protein